jgi:hypothetical protein
VSDKTVRAEVGTTGQFEEVELTEDAGHDIARAVELEHSCEDSHCDIRAALEAGYPFSAAHLLEGATETPLLDAVAAAHGIDLTETPQDWNEWHAYFTENARPCQSCGSFVFDSDTCDNCGGSIAPRPDNESDAFIAETRDGYSVSVERTHIGTEATQEGAEALLWFWTREHDYHPETWLVNERGNTTLLERNESPDFYKTTDIGYV